MQPACRRPPTALLRVCACVQEPRRQREAVAGSGYQAEAEKGGVCATNVKLQQAVVKLKPASEERCGRARRPQNQRARALALALLPRGCSKGAAHLHVAVQGLKGKGLASGSYDGGAYAAEEGAAASAEPLPNLKKPLKEPIPHD